MKRKRILLIATMLLLTAGAMNASLWGKRGDQPAAQAAPAAMTLTAVELDPAPVPRLVLRTTATPAYTSYSPTPDTFIVDLSGASKAASVAIPAALPSTVTSVTAEDVTEMGMHLARVTIHLAAPATLQAVAEDKAVAIPLPAPVIAEAKKDQPPPVEVIAPVASAGGGQAPPPVPAAEPVAEPPGQAGAPVVHEEPAVRAEAIPLPKAKTLKSVAATGSGAALTVQLAGDGDLTYNAFKLEKPSRVVIDLEGVNDAVRKGAIKVDDALVKKIRVAQFKGGASPVTRVVVDLSETSSYNVTKEGDHLLVKFGAGTSTPPVAAAEQKPQPKAEPKPEVKAVDVKPESKPAETKALQVKTAEVKPVETPKVEAKKSEPEAKKAEAPQQVAVIAEPVPEWKMPEKKAEKSEKHATGVIRGGQQPTAPSPTLRSTNAARSAAQAATSAEDVFNEAPQQLPSLGQTQAPAGTQSALGPAATAAAGGRTLQGSERVYTGEPISLNLKDADLKDVIRTFAQLTGLNIAIDPGVGGSVTVDFTDVPWDQALDIILRQNNLGWVLEGNVMRIATLARLADEAAANRRLREEERLSVPTRTVSYKLSYARAQEVAAHLREIASTRARIIVDSRTNQLIISEIPAYLDTMRALIDAVDVPTRQVVIEARIVETSKLFTQQYGFTWGFRGTLDPSLGTGTGLVFPNRIDFTGGEFQFGVGNPVLQLSLGNVLGTFTLDLALLATETEGLSRVISAPRVQTQDNVPAEIQSGFQIPYQTRINFTTTIAYVDATLRLSVTPQITEAGTVIMDIAVQKNEPTTGLRIEGGAGTPLSTRQAKTKLMVRDGGTAVIAGIYQTKENNAQTRLPFLHQIPVLGNLFKTHDISLEHDELLIFITPRIVRTS